MIERNYDKKHPLKIALENYLDNKISYNTFKSIMPKVEHKMNLKWITSGMSTLYDYLFFSDEGLRFVAETSKELEVK